MSRAEVAALLARVAELEKRLDAQDQAWRVWREVNGGPDWPEDAPAQADALPSCAAERPEDTALLKGAFEDEDGRWWL
jgi:hypothetical protein